MTTYEQPKDWIERHLVEDPGGLLACEPSRLDTLNEELRLARQANEAQHQQLDAFQYNREEAFRRHEATRQQLAERDKQVTLLRDGLKRADDLLTHSYDHVSPLIREALDATEPK